MAQGVLPLTLVVVEWTPLCFLCVWLNHNQCLDVGEGVGPAEYVNGILLKWIILFNGKLKEMVWP